MDTIETISIDITCEDWEASYVAPRQDPKPDLLQELENTTLERWEAYCQDEDKDVAYVTYKPVVIGGLKYEVRTRPTKITVFEDEGGGFYRGWGEHGRFYKKTPIRREMQYPSEAIVESTDGRKYYLSANGNTPKQAIRNAMKDMRVI